jgi:nitrite reductase/ring-hydroxylating ferredoxin subunit
MSGGPGALGASGWVRVADLDAVPAGEMLAIEHNGLSIALYHTDDGGWHATDNVCTHAFALLTDGWLEGFEIECPAHAGKFDVRTGKGLCAPIDEPLGIYEVRVEGDGVLVKVG